MTFDNNDFDIKHTGFKMANVLETEDFYDIIKNAEGDLLFSVKARQGGPERPKVIYGGGEHVLWGFHYSRIQCSGSSGYTTSFA